MLHFMPKFSLSLLKFLRFGLVWFYGMSTIVCYLIPIFYTYIKYDFYTYFPDNILNEPKLIFFFTHS